jgi:hypothetical protein
MSLCLRPNLERFRIRLYGSLASFSRQAPGPPAPGLNVFQKHKVNARPTPLSISASAKLSGLRHDVGHAMVAITFFLLTIDVRLALGHISTKLAVA